MRVCQSAHVKSQGWLAEACSTPDPGWIYGGSDMNLKLSLEAVRLTV